MYILDVESPAALAWAGALQAAALVGLYAAGFALAARALAAGRGPRLAGALGVGWTLLVATLFGVLWRRAFTVTTLADFWSPGRPFAIAWGTPDAMLGGPVMKLLVSATVANAAALALLTSRARRRRA
jgi:hypothetical protein